LVKSRGEIRSVGFQIRSAAHYFDVRLMCTISVMVLGSKSNFQSVASNSSNCQDYWLWDPTLYLPSSGQGEAVWGSPPRDVIAFHSERTILKIKFI